LLNKSKFQNPLSHRKALWEKGDFEILIYSITPKKHGGEAVT